MGIISAYIVPHPPVTIPVIGKGKDSQVWSTVKAFEQIGQQIAKEAPETIIVISPHSTIYADYFHISPGDFGVGSMKEFGAPKLKMRASYDKELAEYIAIESLTDHIQAGGLGNANMELDHGTMVPMYFINQYYKDYQLVRISISDFTPYIHYQFGKHIASACRKLNRKVTVIASGDLSHYLNSDGPYGYRQEGPIFDSMITQAMESGDFLQFLQMEPGFVAKAGACGLKSFAIMAGTLDSLDVTPSLLSYDSKLGVGYAVCRYALAMDHVFFNPDRAFDQIYAKTLKKQFLDRDLTESHPVRIARMTLETLVMHHQFLTLHDIVDNLEDELITKKAGAFVCIKKDGQVRGCIGTISPTTGCVAHEIINNAINAGYNDPRFNPIAIDELPYLSYHVDILDRPEPVYDLNELDEKKYGIIVSNQEKRGLLLPDLDSIKDPNHQLMIALQKAGISEDEDYQIERFQIQRFY